MLSGHIVSPYAGYLGVDLFFILPGFLMALNYGRSFDQGFRFSLYVDFLGKRLARVYCLYAFVTLLVLALSFWNIFHANFSLKLVLVNLALAQQLGPGWIRPYLGDSILGGAWSISTELGAYLLFPILYLAACRCGRTVTLVVIAVSFALIVMLALLPPGLKLQQLPSQGPLDLWSGWSAWPLIRCLAEFTIGVGVWRLVSDAPASRFGSDSFGLPLVAGSLLVLFVQGADLLAVLLIAGLIGHLAYHRSRLAGLLGSRPMIWLGEVSYAMYVLHLSLLTVTYEDPAGPFKRTGFHDHYLLLLAVTYTLLLVMSRILFLFVERPARRWVRMLFAMPAGRSITAEPAAP